MITAILVVSAIIVLVMMAVPTAGQQQELRDAKAEASHYKFMYENMKDDRDQNKARVERLKAVV